MNLVKKVLAFLSIYLLFLLPAHSAGLPLTLQEGEIKLKILFDRLAGYPNDPEKKKTADSITVQWAEILNLRGSFDYPFSLLNKAGKIYSPDHKVRIYTWNVPWSSGTNTYFGFLQFKTKNKGEISTIPLVDHSPEINDPESAVLAPANWYGMLIYEIVENESGNGTYYTLLGFDNENLFLSRKIADVLYFNHSNQPVFGKAIFDYHGRNLCRILFEYSAKVQMSLKWNSRMKMIVFDHLSPPDQSHAGKREFYGPDLSFDALSFEKGMWELRENLDVRN